MFLQSVDENTDTPYNHFQTELNQIKNGIVIIWYIFDEVFINVPSSAQCRKDRVKFSCDLGRAGLARVLPFETTDADYPKSPKKCMDFCLGISQVL